MKLFFMKQSAIDYIKSNISRLYKNYYTFDSSEWILKEFDYDPFEFFKEVPDFELANLDMQPGEIDLQNCKTLFTYLKDLSDSQASDERLWAGICNKTFYPYLRERMNLAKKHLKKTADDAAAIISRFFYKTPGRSGMFRNVLARCWWTGRLTYSSELKNPWELLDAIGSEDLISKISDIFYSNTYSSNSVIVKGFCQGLKLFRDDGKRISNREHIRPTAQLLNAIGGSELLDMLTAEEIEKIVVENISDLLKGKTVSLVGDVSEEDSLIDESDDSSDLGEEVNVDYGEYEESINPTVKIDLDETLGKPECVELNTRVQLLQMPEKKSISVVIPSSLEELEKGSFLQRQLLNHSIGYSVSLANRQYLIVDISRNR